MMDRHKIASFVCADKVFATEWDNENPEHRANRYAAELLLPEFMFIPRAKNQEMTFATVRDLAAQFQMSLTATSIRLVELGSYPAMIVCSGPGCRIWFKRGPDVPKSLRVRDKPGAYTAAYDLLRGGTIQEVPLDVDADGWIDHPAARSYTLREDSVKISREMVLSLIWWKDEKQLHDLDSDEE